jgi:hypothetical protein
LTAIVWLCWLFFAVCAAVEIHWVVARVVELHGWIRMDASAWAAWAQAIGAVVAIAVAFHIGAKQSRDAIKAIVFGYDHATRRRYEAYSVIAQAAKVHCEDSLRIFPEGGFGSIHLAIAQLDKKREGVITALEAIPIHEVGTYEAVEALVGLRISMGHLNTAIERANTHLDSFGCSMSVSVPFDTGVIRLNCDMAIAHATNLMEALRRPFDDRVGMS